jgi:hypothetical protein
MTDANKTSGTFDRFELWKEYEGVAMHFNDLIIKLRSQSLGGVAAIATLAAVVARNDTTAELRWGLLTGAFALLCVFWVAVWILDMGYYNRLLHGAVEALLTIESESQGDSYRTMFYLLVFIALLSALGVAIYNLRVDMAAAPPVVLDTFAQKLTTSNV